MTLVPLKRVRLRPAVSLGQEPDEWIEPAKKSRQEQVTSNYYNSFSIGVKENC